MKKQMTCIECPRGCSLAVDIENCKVVHVEGNKCPKGEVYATSEIENPMRIFTSAVLAKKLSVKMVPVRTDKPIPKSSLMSAMSEIKKIVISQPLHSGDIVVPNFLNLNVNLIASREIS